MPYLTNEKLVAQPHRELDRLVALHITGVLIERVMKGCAEIRGYCDNRYAWVSYSCPPPAGGYDWERGFGSRYFTSAIPQYSSDLNEAVRLFTKHPMHIYHHYDIGAGHSAHIIDRYGSPKVIQGTDGNLAAVICVAALMMDGFDEQLEEYAIQLG